MEIDDHIAVGDQRGDRTRKALSVRAFVLTWEHAVQVEGIGGVDPGVAAFQLGGERIGGKDDAQAPGEFRHRVPAEHLDRQCRPGSFIPVGPGDEGHARATRAGLTIFEGDVLGGGMGSHPDLVPYQ